VVKYLKLAAAVAFFMVGLALLAVPPPSSGTPPVVRDRQTAVLIGALWDLSGNSRSQGEAALESVRRAVKIVNAQGGVRRRRLQIVPADTGGSLATLLLKARELVENPAVLALIGPVNEELSHALREYAESNRIPLILISGHEPLLPFRRGAATRWTFSVAPGLAPSIKVFYREFQRLKLNPIGPLVADNRYGKRASLWLAGYGPEYHLNILPARKFKTDNTDTRVGVHDLVREGANALVAWGPRKSGVGLAWSIRDTGLVLAVPAGMISADLLKAAAHSVRLWTAAPPIMAAEAVPSAHPCAFSVSRFRLLHRDMAGKYSPEELMAAGASWDALHLLARGLSASADFSRAGLMRAIEDADAYYSGVMGQFRPSSRDHSGLNPGSLLLLKWSGTSWKPAP